ncbi:neprilysin-1-like [Ornithodoros turicata]|uniref:neprilysin-1-like n=1 Tax=Ornithodoros turicata TaxID=34597 RepID=UPI0031394E1A
MWFAQSEEPLHVDIRHRRPDHRIKLYIMAASFCITVLVLFSIPVAIKRRISLRKALQDKTTTNGNLSVVSTDETNSTKTGDRYCDTEDCRYFHWLVDASVDSTKDPCKNFHAFVCAGIEEKFPEMFAKTRGGMIDVASRNLTNAFYEHLSTTRVPPENQDAFQKAAAVFQNCLKVKEEPTKNKREILNFLKQYGLSFTDAMRFDPLDIMIRFIATIDIPILFRIQPTPTRHNSRVLIEMSVVPDFTSEKYNRLRRMLQGHYNKFVAEVLSTIFSIKGDKALIDAIVKAELKVINASNSRTLGEATDIMTPLEYFGFLQKNILFGRRWKDTLAAHTNNSLPGHYMLSIKALDMELFHFLFDNSSGFPESDLKVFMAWKTTLYLFSGSGLETSSNEWCFDTVSAVFPTAVVSEVLSRAVNESRMGYVKNMTEMISHELEKLLAVPTWLDDESRNASLRKLSLMKRRIGHGTGFTVKSSQESGNVYPDFTGPYVVDFINIRKKAAELRLRNLRMGLVKNNETSPPIHAGNAVYDIGSNAVFVPAGAMVRPLFSYGAPPQVNMGTLGRLYAHEIMRGYDAVGRRFDGSGKPARLWTKKSEDAYRERLTCFNETTALRGRNAHYAHEVLLDVLGQKSVLNAYRRASESTKVSMRPVKGVTRDQLFYASWCMLWCGQRASGSHLQERCNMPLMHSPHFSETFHCSSEAPMNPQKKCLFW